MKPFLISILFYTISHFPVFAQPIKVEIKEDKKGYKLYRGGELYEIKGAGAFDYYDLLKSSGGNSIRLWNTENADYYLETAQELGLTVTLGLFLKPENKGFDYSDKKEVEKVKEYVRGEVMKYKDHPALLMWGIGNELDLFATNMQVWKVVNEIAGMVKEIDPNHPVFTSLAGVPVHQIPVIRRQCKNLDLIGINVFRELPNVPDLLVEAGWHKPYFISEWGARGYWESDSTSWKAFLEESTTEKVKNCKKNFETFKKRSRGNCLGSYVFIWGHKHEGTHTLFSLFLPSGQPTGMVDLMNYLWLGHWPENKAPQITKLTLAGKPAHRNIFLDPGKEYSARVTGEGNPGDKLNIKWVVFKESEIPLQAADYFHTDFINDSGPEVSFRAPREEGAYRLFVYVFNQHNKVATANIPFYIRSKK